MHHIIWIIGFAASCFMVYQSYDFFGLYLLEHNRKPRHRMTIRERRS